MNIILSADKISKQGGISRVVCEIAERISKEVDSVHIVCHEEIYKFSNKNIIIHKLPIIMKPKFFEILSTVIVFTIYSNYLKYKLGWNDTLINGQGAHVLFPDIVTMHSCHWEAVKTARKNALNDKRYGYWLFKTFQPWSLLVLLIERLNFLKVKYA